MSQKNEIHVRKRSMRRLMCERCLRPQTHCLCASIPALDSRTRVVVLQHPDESHHALNTARLAVLGLRNAELHIGRQFDAALWRVEGYRPCLLFPGEGARVLMGQAHADVDNGAEAERVALMSGARGAASTSNTVSSCAVDQPVLLVVPDGTWRHARQLLSAHAGLAALPRLTLPVGITTRYRVRHAGDAHALSTIEAIAAALDVLDAPNRYSALLAPFEKLIEGQIAAMGQDRYQRHHVSRLGSRAAKSFSG